MKAVLAGALKELIEARDLDFDYIGCTKHTAAVVIR